jgi:hypothetical protein
MKWAKVSLTFNYDISQMEADGIATDEASLQEMAAEDAMSTKRWEWEIELFDEEEATV